MRIALPLASLPQVCVGHGEKAVWCKFQAILQQLQFPEKRSLVLRSLPLHIPPPLPTRPSPSCLRSQLSHSAVD